MKNDEVIIYIETRGGSSQTFSKDNGEWQETSSSGNIHKCTAEQVLSHLLPPLLSGYNGKLKVRVERR